MWFFGSRDFQEPPIHGRLTHRSVEFHKIVVNDVVPGLLKEIENVVMFETVAAFRIAVVMLHRDVENAHVL
jgi:hypothetical protein